jgi:transketolase
VRGPFLRKLTDLARHEPRVVLLTGDLGFAAIEPFAEAHPDRFYNVGVAEQNMLGMATGLAEAGFLPFVYSIAPFVTRRPYEFIHNGPVLQKLPVRIVGIGGGFEYGHAGPTHHAIDDVALMRVMPEICIISPADYLQAVSALEKSWNRPGPIYYRLGKDDLTIVPGLDGEFELGCAQLIQEGDDLVFITMGSVATETVAAAATLRQLGQHASVAVVASVRPEPVADLCAIIQRVPLVVTVEAHSINGGLGSLVAEIIAERNLHARLIRCGMRSGHSSLSGDNTYLNAANCISRDALVQQVLTSLKGV